MMTTTTQNERTCRWLWLLPIVTFAFVPGCFTFTYLIAVFKDHVHPILPMISETGEALPENFVFAIVVNCGAFFGLLNYIARYYVLSGWTHQKPRMSEIHRNKFASLNRTALCIAICAVVGALLVANVEANRHLYVHNCGAILSVVMCLAYSWLHTYLTYVRPMQRWTIWLRFGLTFTMTVALVTGASAVPYAHAVPELNNYEPNALNTSTTVVGARFMGYRWVNDQHYYFNALLFYHFTEWLIVCCSGVFLLSFAVEFRHVTVAVPQLYFALTPVMRNRGGDDEREMLVGFMVSVSWFFWDKFEFLAYSIQDISDGCGLKSAPPTAETLLGNQDAEFARLMRKALNLECDQKPGVSTPSHHTRTGSMTTRPVGKHERTRSNGTTIRVIDEFGNTPSIPPPQRHAFEVEYRSPLRRT